MTKLRILLVDDNADGVDSLATLVQMWGHDVRVAYDGESAIPAALEFKPDVAILDLGLPKMTGYEVAARLKEEAGLQIVLLVALTGYGSQSFRKRSEEAGFDAHLTKPASFEVLSKLLDGAQRLKAAGS